MDELLERLAIITGLDSPTRKAEVAARIKNSANGCELSLLHELAAHGRLLDRSL